MNRVLLSLPLAADGVEDVDGVEEQAVFAQTWSVIGSILPAAGPKRGLARSVFG